MKNRLLIAVLLLVQPFLMTNRPVVSNQKQQPEAIHSHLDASQGLGVNLVSHLGGYVNAVLSRDHYVYTGFGPELAVLDISKPTQPKITGSMFAQGNIRDITIDGSYLYLAYASDINNLSGVYNKTGLQIIDIHNPAIPVQVSSIDITGCSFYAHLAASNGYAYLAVTECQAFGGIIQPAGATVYPVDVSDPKDPKVLDNFIYHKNMPFSISGIAIEGDYAYISSHDDVGGFLKIVNSSPLSADFMHEIGSVDVAIPTDIALSDGYAFLSFELAGIQVVDVKTPANPQLISTYALFGNPTGISISGKDAFVAAGGAGLRVVDISTPSAPFEVGYCEFPNSADAVSVAGLNVSVADGSGGIRIIDISNITSPFPVGLFETPNRTNDIAAAGSVAFGAAIDGLWVVDNSHPTNPTLINHFATPGPSVAVLLANDIAYLAEEKNSLHVVNIANPHALSEVGTITIPGKLSSLYKAGNYLYVATKDAGLHILDASTSTAPVEVGHLGATYGINDVEVSGKYAYLATTNGDLRIVDISKPTAPVEKGSYSLPHIYGGGQATSLAVAGQYVFIATVEDGPTPLAGCCFGKVWVVDVSRPGSPQGVGSSPQINAPYRLTLSNNLLYIASGRTGLLIFDISDPANLLQVASYSTSEPIYGVSPSENLIYIYNRSTYILGYADAAALPTVSGRVTGWNHRPFPGASVSAGAWLHSPTDSQGRYMLTGLLPGLYSLTSGTPGTVFFPSANDLSLPPSLSGQDFVILPTPVSTTLRPTLPATLTYTDTQGLPTRLDIPAGAVDLFSTLQLTPTLATADPGFAFTGHAFVLDIYMNTSPTSARLPDFTFNAPIQVTIQYSAANTWVISDMDALTLWWHTDDGWQDAAQTCDPPSVYSRDLQNKTLTISICKTGTFALMGPTLSYYLPLVR